jgi:uncharacterized Zn finger protein (UPF0148 family)
MSEADQIRCPSCGANLGASVPSGEYRCAFCGDVSHQGALRPVYGAREEILASFAREAERERLDQARREGAAQAREEEEEQRAIDAEKNERARWFWGIVIMIALFAIVGVLLHGKR